MGLFGPPDVEKLKAKRDVNSLIKALSYKRDSHDWYDWRKENVRRAAAKALSEIKDPHVVEPLITTLKTGDSLLVEIAVVEALGQIDDARAVEPLIAALKDGKDHVRKAAAEALGKIGDARAVKSLIAALKYEMRDGQVSNRDLHNAAIEALGQIGLPAIELLIAALKDEKVREGATAALVKIGSPATQPLTAALKDSDGVMRHAAVETLDKIGWRPGRDEFGAAYWIAKQNLDACAKIGAPAVEPLVVAFRGSQDSGIRLSDFRVYATEAASALVKIGAPAVEPLIAVLKDTTNHGYVRIEAVGALGKMGDARAVEPLIEALKDEKVRRAAAQALGKVSDARAVEPLIEALKDSYWGVRQAAAKSLEMIGWRPGQDAIGATYWIAQGKWNKCIAIGVPAVAPLVAALKELDYESCQAAARALGEIGDTSAVAPLMTALKHEHEAVRQAAAKALKSIGWQPGQDEDGACYWIAMQEWDQCAALGARAVEPLIAALEDRAVCSGAANALGQVGDARAVGPLIDNLHDTAVHARQSAARALVQLYQRGQLTVVDKDRILSERELIIQEHADRHHDGVETNACGIPMSENYHTDKGIGVDFPL